MKVFSRYGFKTVVRNTTLLAFLLMVFGAVAAFAMTPRERVADQRNYDLEQIIPKSFAGWHEVDLGSVVVPDPSANKLVNKIYNKVLTRTYADSSGQAVMLLIAYGGDQSDALQLHRPEVCYSANGYNVAGTHLDRRKLAGRDLVVTRVDTATQAFHEAVSYWMRVGDRQVTTTMDRQWVKLIAGLRGIIPDGVLVRVSTRALDADADRAYKIHDRFIADMLSSVDGDTRMLLIGQGAPKSSTPGRS